MAAYKQGYDEERFEDKISQNFLCLICFNVLRDPVLCPTNQHCFCRGCITKHLENWQRCPTCSDELTVETLTEPPRMVKDLVDELKIRCSHFNRGCHDIVQLQNLDQHEKTCGFTPVVCTNQDCGVTVNKRDLIHHQSELCEFRKVKCHWCEETTKTLADMKKRIVKIEAIVEKNNADLKTDMEMKLEAVNSEVKGLKTALTESFIQMKDVVEEIVRKVKPAPSCDKENILVAAGMMENSVEMFNWHKRSWSPLQSMPETRGGATSFVHNNHLIIAGGSDCEDVYFGHMIRMSIDPCPHPSTNWSKCTVKLPIGLAYYSSVLYNNQLIVTGGAGGESEDATCDRVYEVQLTPPYAVKPLSRLPEPRQDHSMEIFDDKLLIVGGSTTGRREDSLKSVLLYDLKNNQCKQLAPLPYEVCEMATVRWGDNIVVIGGSDVEGNELNTVVMYNVKTQKSHMLPPMKRERLACAAVVVGNNIVVLGGSNGEEDMKSVEDFNFERYSWENLPEMTEERSYHTAVVA